MLTPDPAVPAAIEAIPGPQHLLIDADDTLWENNIYFERASERFIDILDHEHLSPEEVRTIFDEAETATRATHGYGAKAFAHTLRSTFVTLTEGNATAAEADEIKKLGLDILGTTIEPLPDVIPTLEVLRKHHDLYIVTKGEHDEQRLKVDASGMEPLFDGVIITHEKSPATYHDAVASLDLAPERTWMIGNSPRSDINPALEAGINAVFIPHPHTWRLEEAEITDTSAGPGRLLRLTRFSELARVFPGAEALLREKP
ncbi:MAG: HAD hydrolase-like protein [Chloroflexota bacterium]|nr:HAD hydrolase-like protein [Chloroflexota bacterium]